LHEIFTEHVRIPRGRALFHSAMVKGHGSWITVAVIGGASSSAAHRHRRRIKEGLAD